MTCEEPNDLAKDQVADPNQAILVEIAREAASVYQLLLERYGEELEQQYIAVQRENSLVIAHFKLLDAMKPGSIALDPGYCAVIRRVEVLADAWNADWLQSEKRKCGDPQESDPQKICRENQSCLGDCLSEAERCLGDPEAGCDPDFSCMTCVTLDCPDAPR
jgi:hypothetical protein